MKYSSFGISDIGMKRSNNEDAYLLNDTLGLYMVADGMGGHAGGEFASRLAVTLVEDVMQVYCGGAETHSFYFNGLEDVISPPEALTLALKIANERIIRSTDTKPELKGMGTTAVVVFLSAGTAHLAHVGDSRIYRLRSGKLRQMTDDHSLVNEQLRQGVITAEEAKRHQFKNVITRSIGIQEQLEVDTFALELQSGDRFLLCSDGLSNMLGEEDLRQTLAQGDLASACRRLIELANEHGGDDNVTVVLLELEEP